MRDAMLLGIGLVAGAWASEAIQAPQRMADNATREAVAAVKRGIVEGHRTRDRASLDALYAENFTALDARGGFEPKKICFPPFPPAPR